MRWCVCVCLFYLDRKETKKKTAKGYRSVKSQTDDRHALWIYYAPLFVFIFAFP